jgi:hypothetical protein
VSDDEHRAGPGVLEALDVERHVQTGPVAELGSTARLQAVSEELEGRGRG